MNEARGGRLLARRHERNPLVQAALRGFRGEPRRRLDEVLKDTRRTDVGELKRRLRRFRSGDYARLSGLSDLLEWVERAMPRPPRRPRVPHADGATTREGRA